MDPFNPDEMLVCPYDPVHRVARKRMQVHLVKCRKNCRTSEYRTCPFNAQHIVLEPELSFHIANCPHRCRIEVEQFHEIHMYKQKGNTSIPQSTWSPPNDDGDEETW